jgi:hypothetical protein
LLFGRLLTLAICFQLSKRFVEPFVCHFGLLTIGIFRGRCKRSGRDGLPVGSLSWIEWGQQVYARLPAARQHQHASHLVGVSIPGRRTAPPDGRDGALHRADSSRPDQGAKPPVMIVDFEAQCVFGNDRLWRFQSHLLRLFCIGSDIRVSMSIDPQHL